MVAARCTVLTLIGDLPGMNQVCERSGHTALGRSPEAAQTSIRRRFGGIRNAGSWRPGCEATTASTIWKKSGAAAWTPINAGLLCPSKLPTQTTSTYGPNTPAVQASRNPHDVPVFQATGTCDAAEYAMSGLGLSRSMSSTTKLASSDSNRTP